MKRVNDNSIEMNPKKYIFYGVVLGAFINILNALFGKVIGGIVISLDWSFWAVLPIYVLYLGLVLFLVFFKIRTFPKLKWWYLFFLLIIGVLYYLCPNLYEIMDADYYEANNNTRILVIPIMSILNFSVVLFALIKYLKLDNASD